MEQTMNEFENDQDAKKSLDEYKKNQLFEMM